MTKHTCHQGHLWLDETVSKVTTRSLNTQVSYPRLTHFHTPPYQPGFVAALKWRRRKEEEEEGEEWRRNSGHCGNA